MSAASATARGRAAAQRLLVDTFTAYSPNGYTITDGLEVPAFTSQGSTPGKVQSRGAGPGGGVDTSARTVRIGGVDRPVLQGALHIPVSAAVPVAGDQGIGWEYECTAVGTMSDPALVGRRWLVVGVPAKTFATARRLDVVEVTS